MEVAVETCLTENGYSTTQKTFLKVVEYIFLGIRLSFIFKTRGCLVLRAA